MSFTSPRPCLFIHMFSAVYARKQAEAEELRTQIIHNAKLAEEEAFSRHGLDSRNQAGGCGDETQALPKVLESGFDALKAYDEHGRRIASKALTTVPSLMVGSGRWRECEGKVAAGREGEEEDSSDEEEEGGGEEGQDTLAATQGGKGRKREQTMADLVQLHRDLAELQRTRTELRWLLEQVERLEYESL